jgi:SAM-dependent methyltransferase
MDNFNYTELNSKAIDKWVEKGWEWSIPISHEQYLKAKDGELKVLLTPLIHVPVNWFQPFIKNGRLNGAKLLGLASAGGQQMPVFAALGAECTVLDYSDRQLENEIIISEREGYDIEIIKADMTKRLPFNNECFDIIFHPVANCFIEDINHIWKECFRILRKGGILLAGLDNGLSFLCNDENPLLIVNKLPYNPLKNAELLKKCVEIDGSVQFSHTLDDLLGGQLKTGFTLTDIYEDRDTSILGAHVPLFIATRAVKTDDCGSSPQ